MMKPSRTTTGLLSAMVLSFFLGVACSERIFDVGENHPPDTVFNDNAGFNPPTPQPGERQTSDPIVFHWIGTDVLDGDGIRAFYWKLSPPDTGWTRTVQKFVGFTGLPDTTYEFCVYSEDTRGAVDPVPTCRTFPVDIFRPGSIVFDTPWINRDGEVTLYWHIENSDIDPLQLKVEMWPVLFRRCDYLPAPCSQDPLSDELQTALNWYRTNPDGEGTFAFGIGKADSSVIYCVSVRGYDGSSFSDPEGHQVEPVRYCWPHRP